MGRTKTAIQDPAPIPLPHDGPIYQLFSTSELSKRGFSLHNQEDGDEDQVREATEWLRSIVDNSGRENAVSSLPGSQFDLLVSDLITAETVQEQLRRLRTFSSRQRVLNRKGKNVGDKQGTINHQAIMLYHILLEWMLSARTPVPLRRALQAVCAALFPDDDSTSVKAAIQRLVLTSLCGEDDIFSWQEPLQGWVDVVLTWEPLAATAQGDNRILSRLLHFVHSQRHILDVLENEEGGGIGIVQQNDIARCVRMATLMGWCASSAVPPSPDRLDEFGQFVWALLSSPVLPVDRLPALSILYGKLWVSPDCSSSKVDRFIAKDSILREAPRLTQAHVLSGLAAVLPLDQLGTLSNELEAMSLRAGDSEVRLAAVKGMRALVSRWNSNRQSNLPCNSESSRHRILAITLNCWDDASSRREKQGIAALFQSWVQWQAMLCDDTAWIPGLIQRLLSQPSYRTSRYVALDTLLPLLKTEAEIQTLKPTLVGLLQSVYDSAQNAAAVSDLWANILAKIPDDRSWLQSLAEMLVNKTYSRRKRVAALCLPRIAAAVGGSREREAHAHGELLLILNDLRDRRKKTACSDSELFDGRVLWAQMELIGTCPSWTLASSEFRSCIKEVFDKEGLRVALAHVSPFVRLSGLRATRAILESQDEQNDIQSSAKRCKLRIIVEEIELFKETLPINAKTEGEDFVASILEYMLSLIDTCLLVETRELAIEDDGLFVFPAVSSFVCEFLLCKMVMFLGYPGTASAKEHFLLVMLRILLFFFRGTSVLILN